MAGPLGREKKTLQIRRFLELFFPLWHWLLGFVFAFLLVRTEYALLVSGSSGPPHFELNWHKCSSCPALSACRGHQEQAASIVSRQGRQVGMDP